MGKSRVFVTGMLALALIFGAVQQASAQPADTARERDNLILNGLRNLPHYIVAAGGVADYLVPGITVLASPLDGAFYFYMAGDGDNSYMDMGRGDGILFITLETSGGNRGVIIVFSSTKENAEKVKANNAGRYDVFGPFGGDSSEAGRRAALQRILAAVKAYAAKDVMPQQW
ncbi:MAG: hypothetical protein LBK77_00680 [Spirochaetaceae bacterium]|jgi:hypothetical protein|nr:hypothetical protein [Spirochaetaceae bacterium]